MATDWRAGTLKSISWRMTSVPVESLTCLVTCSTRITGISDMDGTILKRLQTLCGLRWTRHCSALALTLWALVSGNAAIAQSIDKKDGAATGAPVILVVGDSLSAEYGIARDSGWTALLQQRLRQEGMKQVVVNASISGDTTSGGRSRLGALLSKHRPQVVVIELGGNDALRGLPLDMTRENLSAMVRQSQAAGARVLLAGMQLPPNYGAAYAQAFAALYGDIARAQKVALVPFFLKNVADAPDAEAMFQADRIHPTAQAHPRILAIVWPHLRSVLSPGRPL